MFFFCMCKCICKCIHAMLSTCVNKIFMYKHSIKHCMCACIHSSSCYHQFLKVTFSPRILRFSHFSHTWALAAILCRLCDRSLTSAELIQVGLQASWECLLTLSDSIFNMQTATKKTNKDSFSIGALNCQSVNNQCFQHNWRLFKSICVKKIWPSLRVLISIAKHRSNLDVLSLLAVQMYLLTSTAEFRSHQRLITL